MQEFFKKLSEKWYFPFFVVFLIANHVGAACAIILYYVLSNDSTGGSK